MDLEQVKNLWLGKIVEIYPGDTYLKYGKILDISSIGTIFLIVDRPKNLPLTHKKMADGVEWPIGKMKFISISKPLSYNEI